jgi:hypothetical protein
LDAPKPGQDIIETKEIEDIQVMKFKNNRKRYVPYKVTTIDGGKHWLKKVSQNPKHLIFVNHKPVATCSVNYTPISHSILKDTALTALTGLNLKPVDIDIKTPNTYQWIMTVTLEKNRKFPVGHLKQFEKFDWGIALTNSYDMSMGVNAMIYTYRQICSNGMYGYDPIDRKRFTHIEKARDEDMILERVRGCISDTVTHVKDYFDKLEETTKIQPTPLQLIKTFKKLKMRKTELEWLREMGIETRFKNHDRGDIVNVELDSKLAKTEYDVINAITSISGRVDSMSRMLELQMGIMETLQTTRQN